MTKVIYSQYWFIPKVEITFLGHMAIMQARFGHPKIFGNSNTFDGPLLNPKFFYQQFIFFKLTMQNHCQATICILLIITEPHACGKALGLITF